MRLKRKEAVWLGLVMVALVGSVHGQDEPERRPALLKNALNTLDLSSDEAQLTRPVAGQTPLEQTQAPAAVATPQKQLPPARIQQDTTVSERLKSIRSRSVDTAIGKPFMVADPRQQGTLKAVPKRSLLAPKPEEKKIAQQPAPKPTLAAQPIPHPASALNTAPLSTAKTAASPQPAGHPTTAAASSETTLLTNRAPSLSFETYGPKQIVIGRQADFRVRILNTGKQDASSVTVSVQLPTWAEVLVSSASAGAAHSEKDLNQNTIVRWELEALAGNDAETLTLSVIPRDSRPFDLAVGWTYEPDQSLAQIEVQEPKLELAIDGPQEVEYGETQTYRIAVSNPGTGAAENVVLSLIPMMAQQQVAGSRNLGTIAAGDRKTIDIELTAHQAGRLRVRAAAHAAGGLRSEIDQEVIVRRANLDVVILGPPRNFAATVATYKVRVENTGDAVAEEAIALASLPAGATYVSCTGGGTYNAERGQIEWNVGQLRPNTAREMEVRCELHSPGDNRIDIQCSAQRDLNVSKSLVTSVEALADLVLHVDDPKGAIAVGQHAEYDIRISNRGTKAAENIQVMGYFSEGIEPVSIRNGRGELTTGQVTMDMIPSIGPGQELVFRIVARAQVAGNHVFRTELQCNNPETKLAAEEWTKYFLADGGAEVRQASLPQIESAGTLQIAPQ